MNTPDIRTQLDTIQKRLHITQTKLATMCGVSFAALNAWKNGRALPRPKKRARIEELYGEVTGRSNVAPEILAQTKKELTEKQERHANIVAEILARQDLFDTFALALTYHTNRIEGSTLSERETAAVLFDDISLPDKTLTEQLEARNHLVALEKVFERCSAKRAIDEDFILSLHGILMNGILPDAGTYRTHPVRIVGTRVTTTNPLKVAEEMGVLSEIISKDTDDIVAHATRAHAAFEKIHPFSDGNGRVGRLILTGMLLAANFPPAIITQERKLLYYTYLEKAQTSGEHGNLELFITEAIEKGFALLEE